MGEGRTVIHCNPSLAHQVKHAEAFAAGFQRHGIACEISSRPDREADMHVVLGPHYALDYWRRHPRCLWLDRAYWGDPDYATVGWSQGTTRKFAQGDGARNHPALQPWRDGRNCIVLSDYRDDGQRMAAMARPHVDRVEIRRHPVEGGAGTLSDALRGFQIAIGHRTTALIEAAISGLTIVCTDPDNPVRDVASSSIRDLRQPDRSAWIGKLSWHQWNHDEIASGECWEWIIRCD